MPAASYHEYEGMYQTDAGRFRVNLVDNDHLHTYMVGQPLKLIRYLKFLPLSSKKRHGQLCLLFDLHVYTVVWYYAS